MPEQFQNRDISLELKESYLDYAMSVIVSRALPDARDGLKPVQRRILYAMNDLGLNPSAKFRKSATVVGEVLGKYHPHGDIAVYDALARMAQDFSLREPLINGQGNFGSVDGDPPAAMRYTEVKLNAIAQSLLEDIDEETVDFVPNYDGSRTEPTVLPNRVPQLLLNGAMGIAVGMATNIPPHNLNETIDASIYLIDHPQANSSDLVKFVLGPDFPTGGTIYGQENIAEIYASGRGTVLCRGKAEIEEENKYRQIVITELPYLVNKAELVAKIANLAEEKKIEGIKDLRDESDKEGLRITIDLKNEAIPKKILNQLYKYTDLEKPFHVNMLALIDKGIQPSVLSIKELISEFLNHRKEVIFRRTQFRLKKAKERAHILEGLAKALDHIDEIIKLIRSADDKADAQKKLISKFSFSEIQANAILEMRLSNLAKLERNNIEKELAEKKKIIKEFELILKESKRIFEIIKKELQESKEKYGSPRRTRVVSQMPDSISDDDLIVQKEVIITLSKTGYIKRMAPENLKAQKRGGKGVIAYESKNEEDFIEQLVSCSTHDQLIFFTDKGKA
ncbi:MAG: DNA topoisomerase 4 subunit A, partial [Candidatus Parcubacteria bacterium]|nr:DNA topoisomerase 4 subunit A [Candidatus Parcubacteria bacterium]